MIADYLRRIGFLRAILMLGAVLLIILAPFSGGRLDTSGWALVTTLIAPVGFVIFAFLLILDMIMTRVFMLDSSDEDRRRFVLIIKSEAIVLVLLLLAWTPFMIALLSPVSYTHLRAHET